jgi:hypothetical protein
VFITGGAFTPKAREYLTRVSNVHLEKPFEVASFKKTGEHATLGTPLCCG